MKYERLVKKILLKALVDMKYKVSIAKAPDLWVYNSCEELIAFIECVGTHGIDTDVHSGSNYNKGIDRKVGQCLRLTTEYSKFYSQIPFYLAVPYSAKHNIIHYVEMIEDHDLSLNLLTIDEEGKIKKYNKKLKHFEALVQLQSQG